MSVRPFAIFKSSTYPNKVLAAQDVTLLFLQDYNPASANQIWGIDRDYGNFHMFNQGTQKYMRYGGVPWTTFNFRTPETDPPEGVNVYFSLGDPEKWGAQALRCNADTGQNVDAGIDSPTVGPLSTRGWRDGHQREVTWNIQLV